jgi:hypothetical protein
MFHRKPPERSGRIIAAVAAIDDGKDGDLPRRGSRVSREKPIAEIAERQRVVCCAWPAAYGRPMERERAQSQTPDDPSGAGFGLSAVGVGYWGRS